MADVAGAGGDVEHQVALADRGGLHERGPELGDQVGGDVLVVARRPHGGVLLLQCGVGVESSWRSVMGFSARAWPGPSGHAER